MAESHLDTEECANIYTLPVSGAVGGTRLLLIIAWSVGSIMSYTLSPWATKSTYLVIYNVA